MLAMPFVKDQIAGAVDEYEETALQTGLVQSLHAHQAVDQELVQAGDRVVANAAQEILQRIVDRAGVLCRAGEAVEVGQQFRAVGVELVVELASAAQFADEQQDAQPEEK